MVVAVSPCLTAFRLTFLFPSGVLGPVLLAAFLLLASILRCDVIGVHSAWQDVWDVRRGIASIRAASLPLPGVRLRIALSRTGPSGRATRPSGARGLDTYMVCKRGFPVA